MLQTTEAGTPPAPATAFRPTKWSVIWLLTLTIFSALTVGGLAAPLLESIKADLKLSDWDLGLLAGMATLIPTAVLSIPIAWMVDHSTRTRLLIVLASCWAVGTIGTAFATDFTTFFLARLIAGIGGGCAFPVLVSILADVCMPERRGRSMLLVSIGAWGGVAAAFAIGGTLFGYLSKNPGSGLLGMTAWREVHLLVGIGAALLVLPLFMLKEPPRYEVERASVSIRDAMQALWLRKGFLGPLMFAQLTGGLAEGAAAIWMGAVLVRQYGQSPGDFGAWVGLVILGSGIVGSIIGGFAADAGTKLKMRGGILLPALIATALTIPAGAFSIMPTVTGFAWVLFALLTGGTIINLVCSASIAVLIPNEERAITLAGMKIVNTFVVAGVAPPLIGWIASYNSGPRGLGEAIAVLGVVTGFISLIGFWFAMRGAPEPVARDPDAKMIPAMG
ncbi:MFS transporter [Sphingomonas sp. AOB5]|uniref:MFS transporter n=1 Tax=Sphingomonas sp. AOB5 TaxID=3034017 RepID=UPI0023F8CC5F|nr:MFS transporter [Sphingomonas sp. AOB5]MDF7776122.1 MFS transporter [Sphingomonas sp. AOB5]